MNTPPEPAPPPKRETFADWMARNADLPHDLIEAAEQDRSPYEVEFRRRVGKYGDDLSTLPKPRGLETLRRNGNGPRFSRLSKGRLVRYFAADLDEFLRSGMVEGLGADK